MRPRPWVAGLVGVFLLVGCQDDSPASDGATVPDDVAEGADTVAYESGDGSYTLQLPATWQFDETAGSLSASPRGQETPALRASVVAIEQGLDDYLEEQVGDHPDARISTVETAGATEARLVERDFDDGGLHVLVAAASPARVVAVTVLWSEDDDFDPQAASAILDTLELLGDSDDPAARALRRAG